jgi:phage/plasmid-associated DNA primase
MKQAARPRLKESDWRQEEPRILTFCLDRLQTMPGARTPMREVYSGYQEWLRARGHRTKLSIDGFGRLFPRCYERKVIAAGKGKTMRALIDVRLK